MSELKRDFRDYFEKDNFTSRRTTGHNLYDPESLITGYEADAGFTYENSERAWPNENVRQLALSGDIDVNTVLRIAPRVFKGSAGLTPEFNTAVPALYRKGAKE